MTDTMTELLNAIKEHSNMDNEQIREAGTYGADAGWPGFTYTSDGADFYRANSELIDDLLAEEADAFGYPNTLAFIASFNRADMGESALGLDCLKAWYVLEVVGQWLENRDEEE